MKVCIKCGLPREDEEFPLRDKRTGKRNNTCNECHKKYVKHHYRENKDAYVRRAKLHTNQQREINREKMFEFLTGKTCLTCGNPDIRVLDFDHRDRTKKRRDVGQMVIRGYAWETIMKEIAKCTITCANCHRIKTSDELGWYKSRFTAG